jgi:hypothetical protein
MAYILRARTFYRFVTGEQPAARQAPSMPEHTEPQRVMILNVRQPDQDEGPNSSSRRPKYVGILQKSRLRVLEARFPGLAPGKSSAR